MAAGRLAETSDWLDRELLAFSGLQMVAKRAFAIPSRAILRFALCVVLSGVLRCVGQHKIPRDKERGMHVPARIPLYTVTIMSQAVALVEALHSPFVFAATVMVLPETCGKRPTKEDAPTPLLRLLSAPSLLR